MPNAPTRHRPPQWSRPPEQRPHYHKWYALKTWRTRRANWLAKHPLCAECERQGLVNVAVDVDHIEDHRGDWMAFISGAVQSLCKRCHGVKTRALRGRQVELAKRLAMLHAVSLSPDADTIDAHSTSWACNLVEHLSNRMVWHSSSRIASSAYESQLKELVRFVTECGAAGATRTTIARKFGRFPTKLRNELLNHAAESGQIITEKIETDGAPRYVFRSRQFVAAM